MESSHKLQYWIRKILKWILYIVTIIFLLGCLTLLFFSWQASKRETKNITDIAPKTGHFVKANDVEVFIQESGPTSGKSVLLIHGTGAWSEIWRDLIKVLSQNGFHTIAVDLPPFGYSEKPSGVFAYSRENQAKRLVGVLDALKIRRAVFVGHSVGARPTIEVALEMPDRVEKLILVDPALGFQSSSNDIPHFEQNKSSLIMDLLFGIKPLRNAFLGTYGTNPLSIKKILSSFVSNKEAVTDDRVKMLQKPLVAQNTTNGYGDWLEYLATYQDTSMASDFKNFKKLSMPVILIWGSTDTITPLWQGKQLNKLIPDSKLIIMNNVGHIPYIEDTENFNQILLKNLK